MRRNLAVLSLSCAVLLKAQKIFQQRPFLLVSGPLLFLSGFAFIFWLGRGVSALGFLARYRVGGQGYAAVDAADHALTAAGARGA